MNAYALSRHAAEEVAKRQIDRAWLDSVLAAPEQRIPRFPDKEVLQSRFAAEDGKMYLLRVVVAVDKDPPIVVTVYRTSKIAKYWRADEGPL